MNKYYVLAVFTGAVGGALLPFFYFKKKYKTIADEEIQSVKDTFSERKEKTKTLEQLTNYDDRLKESSEPQTDRPYVISPDDFGEYDDYETISLNLYADGILADDNDEIISTDEMDEIIGREAFDHFGEYEEDSVFIRNDAHKCDYEILKSLEDYTDVLVRKPYLAR